MTSENSNNIKLTHGYEVDGTWYPRVTKIVEIKAKPALYRFYGKMSSFAEGERVKEISAGEGTLVHETIEHILLGRKMPIPPSIEPSIRAFLDFLITNNIKAEAEFVERRLVNHKERYAGTLDAVASINGRLGILDIKTSQEIYRDYNLQTAAYFAAMKDVVPGLETRWILRVDQTRPCLKCKAFLRSKGGRHQIKNGWSNGARECNHEWGALTGKVELKEFPLWEDDFAAFLGAKKLWEWENVNWLRDIGYLS
ncbi:MAG: hypothetical protein Q7R98_02415 [Candidatus Jorgensenbacteria bacterium]|nr:hypothetical protein [Candidatus Jorgensenbacteria bacterium]